MSGEEDRELRDRFGDVLDALGKLAGAVRRERYPGAAWPVRRRRVFLLRWPAIAAGVAAAVLLVIVLYRMHTGDGGRGVAPVAGPVASAPAEEETIWSIPSEIDPSLASGIDPSIADRIDPSIAGEVSLEIPSLSIPSVGDTGGFEWTIPSVSFPSLEERNGNHGT